MQDVIAEQGEKMDCYTDWLMKRLNKKIDPTKYVVPPCEGTIDSVSITDED